MAEDAAATPAPQPNEVDIVLWAAKAGAAFLNQIASALSQYKETGSLPHDLVTVAGAAGAKKRGKAKLPKLNKDGSVKQPRKPTAYNHWMQNKLKELKASVDHDPQQKHVDTFKQAASMWGAMPDDEKKKINDDFKASNAAHANGDAALHPSEMAAIAMAEGDESSSGISGDSDEEEDEAEVAPPPKPAALAPAPAPAPIPIPQPAATAGGESHKKKKKRKSENAEAAPAVRAVTGPEGEKKRKKKSRKDKE